MFMLLEFHQLGLAMIAQGLSRPSALWVHFFELIPPACVGFVCGAWYLCDLQPPQVVAGCGWQCNLRYAYAMLCTTPRRGQQTNSFSDSLLHQTGNDTHSRSMVRLVQSGGSVIIRMLSCSSWERVAILHHFLPCFSYPNMKAVCSSSVHYFVK